MNNLALSSSTCSLPSLPPSLPPSSNVETYLEDGTHLSVGVVEIVRLLRVL